MALVKCVKCGEQVSDRASACIHCGTSIVKLDAIQEIEKQKKYSEELKKEKEILELQNEQLKEEIKTQNEQLIEEIKAKNEQLQQGFKSELERNKEEKQKLENEKINLIEELNSEKLKRQNDDIEKEKLKQELDNMMQKNNKLESKLNDNRNEVIKDVTNKTIKAVVSIVNGLRYLLSAIFFIGAIVFITDKDYKGAIQVLIFTVTLLPFIYKMIWKKINISTTNKIIIQAVVPIVTLILVAIVLGG